MKTPIIILAMALSLMTKGFADWAHLSDSRSPLLTANKPQPENEGIWIPHTYGGVTAVEIDLNHVGSNKMLRAFFSNGLNAPVLGQNFKVHTDETTEFGAEGGRRRVILVDDETLQDNRKRVICYTASYNSDKFDESGTPLSSEGTQYTLTISEIRDDLEVLYLLQFDVSFPNSKHPYLTKPPKREQAGAGQPATRSESDSEGADKPQTEAEGRSR